MKGVIIMRKNKKDYYLSIAKAVSQRSTCLRRKYGAVIVNNDEIISTGYNGSPRGEVNCCDTGVCKRQNIEHGTNYELCRSVHAEMNAIISASRKDMLGSTLYLYGEENGQLLIAVPCNICERLIKNAGIKEVISL
jgi:dCMP deaminase